MSTYLSALTNITVGFLAVPGLTFLVLAQRTDPIAAETFDLTQPLFAQRTDLSCELHFCDFRIVVGAVPFRGR